MARTDVFSGSCEVTVEPEDHGLHVKEDGRERGLWFYVGPPANDWTIDGREKGFTFHPVLLTWEKLEELRDFLNTELRRKSGSGRHGKA